MNRTMVVETENGPETRYVDFLDMEAKPFPQLVPSLREGEEVMRFLDGTLYVVNRPY